MTTLAHGLRACSYYCGEGMVLGTPVATEIYSSCLFISVETEKTEGWKRKWRQL